MKTKPFWETKTNPITGFKQNHEQSEESKKRKEELRRAKRNAKNESILN